MNKAENELKDAKISLNFNEAQLKKKDEELRQIQKELGTFESRIEKLQK